MKYELVYTHKAWGDLQKIGKSNARKIAKKLRYFVEMPDPLKQAKPLKGIYKGLFRFRVGDYRAIFSKDAKGNLIVLTIVRVGHRRDIY